MRERIVGTTKITDGWKIALIQDVREVLDKDRKDKLKIGNKIVYYLRENEIIIRRA